MAETIQERQSNELEALKVSVMLILQCLFENTETIQLIFNIFYLYCYYCLYHIQAIFNDQLKDNNENDATDVWKPLDVTVTVFPEGFTNLQQNSILVDLHVRASENYPNE